MIFPLKGKECDEFDRAVGGDLSENATFHRGTGSVTCNDSGY